MAVTQTVTRNDTVTLIGPLAEIYEKAAQVITKYLEREWRLERSTTDPNQGPRMELRFIKERVDE